MSWKAAEYYISCGFPYINNKSKMDKLTVTFREMNYTISPPTLGQFLDIEAIKVASSAGAYKAWLKTPTAGSLTALDLTDTVSYISVLCPQIVKDLNVSDLMSVDLDVAIDLLELYETQVAPWIKTYQDKIKKHYERIAATKDK